jgi:hypothetical protein
LKNLEEILYSECPKIFSVLMLWCFSHMCW